MNNQILFMVVNQNVQYLSNSPMDHREWYQSLGYDMNLFENIIRGYVMEGKIIFFKGSTFNYDQEVITCARQFSPRIRRDLQIESYPVYCGITIPSPGAKWEPVLQLKEEELTGIPHVEVKQEEPVLVKETGPAIEFKNDVSDESFSKRAIVVTGIVLVITFVLKIVLFSQDKIMHFNNFMDVILSLLQIGLLGYSIFLYSKKESRAKYTALGASLALLFTFQIWDIVLGILYFLFTIDQSYFVNIVNLIKGNKKS